MLYYKKVVEVVHAIQLTETNIKEVGDFLGEHKNFPECVMGGIDPNSGIFILRITPSTHKSVYVGDYIARKSSTSIFSVLPKDEFEKTYSPVE